jgi:hypothetical protein
MGIIIKLQTVLMKIEHPDYNVNIQSEAINTIEKYWDKVGDELVSEKFVFEEIEDLPTFIKNYNSGSIPLTLFFQGKPLP